MDEILKKEYSSTPAADHQSNYNDPNEPKLVK